MKKYFASDTAYKIYSIIIAVLLWAFVVYNQNPESTKSINSIPIYYTNLEALEKEGFVVLQQKEPTVDIRIKGRRLSIGKVDRQTVSASAEIPELRAGTYDIGIDVRLPLSDVSVTDKNPYVIRTVVEKILTKELPVDIKYTGTAKDPFTSVQAVTTPEKVTLWGPESVISSIASLEASIDLGTITDGGTTSLKFRILDQQGGDVTNDANIRKSTDTVSVTSSIYRIKDVKVVPEYTGALPEGYALKNFSAVPQTVRLGSKDLSVDALTEVRTTPIDLSGITRDTKLTTTLAVPDGITNLSDTLEIEVTLQIETVETKTVSIQNVSVHNAASGMLYSVRGLPVEVRISGASSLMDSPTVTASVDVAGYAEGSHQLPLILEMKEGISTVGETYVTVEITASSSSPSPEPTTSPAPI